jgi:hypothetical protein
MALGDEAAQHNTRGDRRAPKPAPVPVQPTKVDDTTPSSKEN